MVPPEQTSGHTMDEQANHAWLGQSEELYSVKENQMDSIQLVTAPTDAEDTSFAYLAKTPLS